MNREIEYEFIKQHACILVPAGTLLKQFIYFVIDFFVFAFLIDQVPDFPPLPKFSNMYYKIGRKSIFRPHLRVVRGLIVLTGAMLEAIQKFAIDQIGIHTYLPSITRGFTMIYENGTLDGSP